MEGNTLYEKIFQQEFVKLKFGIEIESVICLDDFDKFVNWGGHQAF